jgi:hypothetical protein
MSQRRHNLFCLLLGLILAAQAFLPSTALADVSMRCTGINFNAACSSRNVPVEEISATAMQMAQMPCCQGIHPCAGMKASTAVSHITPRKCLLLVHISQSPQSARISATKTHLQLSSPALAPQNTRDATACSSSTATDLFANCFARSTAIDRVHGSRAPPCA